MCVLFVRESVCVCVSAYVCVCVCVTHLQSNSRHVNRGGTSHERVTFVVCSAAALTPFAFYLNFFILI